MEKVFLIFGYGIPENIFDDVEYRSYLGGAFNRIFEYSRENKNEKIHIILSGGKTDMVKPYKRSEAGEMKRFFDFLRRRDFVRKVTKGWTVIVETNSLSTMENMINSKKMMDKRNMNPGCIGIFCEFTRKNRVRRLAEKILGPEHRVEIFNIDFSTSKNRYLDKDYILHKEKKALEFDLWALKSEENFKAYHKNFVEKFNFIRSYGLDRRQEAIKAWWDKGGDSVALKKKDGRQAR